MSKGLKWMLMGIFLAVVSVWCLLYGGVLAAASVFLIILAAGFFMGGYTCGQKKNPYPPEYPMENNKKEQES